MLSKKIKQEVFIRAKFICEYCLTQLAFSSQPFVCEHIIPTIKNGTDDLDNLASSCGGCNGHKYDKIVGRDPVTNQVVPLFNPRSMIWQEHFKWSSDLLFILGITDIGRATIETLKLNREGVVNIRLAALLLGRHPPI